MDKYEEVVQCLRSCLTSTKHKCDLKQLKNDYKTLMGADIPFRQFQFDTLEKFLRSIPCLTVTASNGQVWVEAKADAKTQHITDMIKKQKAPRKKISGSKFKRHDLRNLLSNSSPSKFKLQPQFQRSNSFHKTWQPKNAGRKNNHYTASQIPAAVSHNQFVSPSKSQNSNNFNNKQRDSPPRYNNQNGQRHSPQSQQENNKGNGGLNYRLQTKHNNASNNYNNNNNNYKGEENYNGHTQNRNRIISPPATNSTTNQFKSILKKSPQSPQSSSESFDYYDGGYQESMINRLNGYLERNNLPKAEYTVMQRKSKSEKATFFDCSLKIGQNTYLSYPNDFLDELSAKNFVAKSAFEEWVAKLGKNQQLLVSTAEDILHRIPPIVEKHYHGIWNSQLEADYQDIFNEKLPANWLEIIDRTPYISVEQSLANKFVLRYCKTGEKSTSVQNPLTYDLSIPSNTINFNEDGTLIAEVTCLVSAKEIWCRQLGTPEAESFVQMSLHLNNVVSSPYKQNPGSLRAKDIKIGGYYIGNYENTFIRVRVLEVFNNEVNCFQVDFGDECTLPKEEIYNIQREFARDQGQAFICRLAGLEDLYEFSASSECLQTLVGKQVIIQADNDSAFSDPNDPVISVVIYDNKTRECLNKELITQLTIESATPTLRDGINEVIACHKSENGDVYVQISSPGLEQLEYLVTELQQIITENMSSYKQKSVAELSLDKLYFAKYKEDGQFYRMKILDISPCKKFAQIFFVDFGNDEIVTIKNELFIPLDELSDVISQYPPQAVRVKMSLEIIPENFKEMFDKLVSDDQTILLKVVKKEEGVPVVELYKRSEPDGILFSINKNIALESEMNKGDGNNNNNVSQKFKKLMSLNQFDDPKNVPSSGSLKCPDVGKVGQYFDVIIPHAVSPWNFFVQPYAQHKELCELQKKLQNKYNKTDFSPLRIEDIQPGKIYASKHTDGNWYRTSVLKIIGPGSISVCYCDYGFYSNVSVNQLVSLGQEFVSLPYQAVKAKLDGIKPIRDKWSLEDCTFFQKLVVKKSFVSVITSFEKDELYKLDTVLNLNLYDTSTQNDVNIAQYMVSEKKAIAK